MDWTTAYLALMVITNAYMCFRWAATGIDGLIKLTFFIGSLWSAGKLAEHLGFIYQI